jgi:hypothetical protein
MPAEVREAIVATLADILIADYQGKQRLTGSTGVEDSLNNRKSRGQKPMILSRGYKPNGG